MKSVSIVSSATPERVWAIYSALTWQAWDHDIAAMVPHRTSPAAGLTDGSQVVITMKKDAKEHIATISDVVENESFTCKPPISHLPSPISDLRPPARALEGEGGSDSVPVARCPCGGGTLGVVRLGSCADGAPPVVMCSTGHPQNPRLPQPCRCVPGIASSRKGSLVIPAAIP